MFFYFVAVCLRYGIDQVEAVTLHAGTSFLITNMLHPTKWYTFPMPYSKNVSGIDAGAFHFHQLVDTKRGVGMRGKQPAHATRGEWIDREHMGRRPLGRF